MKKLFGKIILAILTVCMCFAAIGCGGSGDGGNDDGGNNPPAHTAHTFVNGQCSCGQYELFLAVSDEVMSNFTLYIEVGLDTRRTSPDGETIYGPEWGTRKTVESHVIKIADGKFYEQYTIMDYNNNGQIIEQGQKTFTGSEAATLISSVVSQIRGYAFREKFYAGQNLFRSTENGYVLDQSFGFGYNGYYYNENGGFEVRNNTSVEVMKDNLTILTYEGKLLTMTFTSKENCSDAQKSWYIDTLNATYVFSDYGTTVID